MDGPPENDVCSICGAGSRLPFQANCSHWFCGNCIVRRWDYGAALPPCKCPLCRREITLLVPSEATSRRRDMADAEVILERIERYNGLYGERPKGLLQRLQDLPFFLKRLLRDILDPQRSLPFITRARIFLAMIFSAIYVISPVDIIPEGLLGIMGFLDDLIVVFIFFLHVAALYRALLVTRHGGHQQRGE